MTRNGEAKDIDQATEALLEEFFQAGRSETPVPRLEFLSAILADAAGVGPVALPEAQPRRPAPGRVFAAFGGWRGGLVLATCAVLGFWIGVESISKVRDGQSFESASSDGVDDPTAAFFDLASVEG